MPLLFFVILDKKHGKISGFYLAICAFFLYNGFDYRLLLLFGSFGRRKIPWAK